MRRITSTLLGLLTLRSTCISPPASAQAGYARPKPFFPTQPIQPIRPGAAQGRKAALLWHHCRLLTLAMNYTLVTTAWKAIELKATYRHYDYNNDTPVRTFTPVEGDAATASGTPPV